MFRSKVSNCAAQSSGAYFWVSMCGIATEDTLTWQFQKSVGWASLIKIVLCASSPIYNLLELSCPARPANYFQFCEIGSKFYIPHPQWRAVLSCNCIDLGWSQIFFFSSLFRRPLVAKFLVILPCCSWLSYLHQLILIFSFKNGVLIVILWESNVCVLNKWKWTW